MRNSLHHPPTNPNNHHHQNRPCHYPRRHHHHCQHHSRHPSSHQQTTMAPSPPRNQYFSHPPQTHQYYYHPFPFNYPRQNQTLFHPCLLLYNDPYAYYPQPNHNFGNLVQNLFIPLPYFDHRPTNHVQSGNLGGNVVQESSGQRPRSGSGIDTVLLRHILRNQDDGTAVLDEVEVELGNIRMRFSANEDGTFPMTGAGFVGEDGGDSIYDKGSGLSEEEISKQLKTRIYQTPCVDGDDNGGGGEGGSEICVVCQSEYENGETLGTLECRHEFHSDCIKQWLPRKNCCPVCKRTAIRSGTHQQQ